MNRVRDEIEYRSWKRSIYNGRGVGIAILDTGTFLHEDFASRVTCFRDFVNGRKIKAGDILE